MQQGEQNKSFIFHGAGGAADVVYPLEKLRFISQHTGRQPHELFDFFIGDSVSSLLVAGLNIPDEENPAKSKYAIDEYAEIIYANIADFIPYNMITPYRLATNGKRLDRGPLERGLMAYFGDATLGQTLNSTLITTLKIHPGEAEPYIFASFRPDIFELNRAPSSLVQSDDVPLYQAAMAAMAHDVVFGSYEVAATRTVHADFAAVSNHSTVVRAIQAGLAEGYTPVYSFFGTKSPPEHGTVEAIAARDASGLLSRTKMQAFKAGAEALARKSERFGIAMDLGEDNMHILEVDIQERLNDDIRVPTNEMDTRAPAMKARMAAAQADIEQNRDTLSYYSDMIGDNFDRRQQREAGAAFLNAVNTAPEDEQIAPESWGRKLWDSLSFLNSKTRAAKIAPATAEQVLH